MSGYHQNQAVRRLYDQDFRRNYMLLTFQDILARNKEAAWVYVPGASDYSMYIWLLFRIFI